MTSSPQKAKQAILDIISESQARLSSGHVDVTGLEKHVRDYCELIAAMPAKEGLKYAEDLQSVMHSVTEFGKALTAARDDTRKQLEELEKIKKAHDAYHKIGNKDA